jgi:hypothetical protein
MSTIIEEENMIDGNDFEDRTGRKPEHDDLERVNCNQAGETGHWSCGWCDEHYAPRFECGCRKKTNDPPKPH